MTYATTPHAFPAAHHGVCASCGHDIDPGQLIVRHPDGWTHESCLTRPEHPVDVCGSCFQTRANNGSCGCPEED